MKKIAVLRANALGDFIFILPALQALKEKFPDAEIVLLGKDWHKGYLANRPGPVDRVVVVPPYPGVGESQGFQPDHQTIETFFIEMQKEKFDVAFQLHGGGKNSNPFISRLRAKLTIGLKTPDALDLDISVPYVYYFSEILRYLEVVAQIGATTRSIEPVVEVTENDLREVESILSNLQSKTIAIVHPGASDRRRRWPGKNFAQIADFLIEKNYSVYITGVPSETNDVNEVLLHTKHKNCIQNLCGKLSLNALTGLLSKAHILVSNDTGPLHLARALKIPTIGIYWAGNAITGLPMATSLHRSLPSFAFHCPICGLSASKIDKDDPGTCKHDTSFVADIEVGDVRLALEELIDTNKMESPPSNFQTISKVKLEREEI